MPFRKTPWMLVLLGSLGTSIPTAIAVESQPMFAQKAAQSVAQGGGDTRQDRAGFTQLLKQVTLNPGTPSNNDITFELEDLELKTKAALVPPQKAQPDYPSNIVDIDYTITNHRSEAIAVLNKLPPLSYFSNGVGPDFAPIISLPFQHNSDLSNPPTALRGWNPQTFDSYGVLRMFLAKPLRDSSPLLIDPPPSLLVDPRLIRYLVMPGRTILQPGETVKGKARINFTQRVSQSTNNWTQEEKLLTQGMNFCIQVVTDEQVIQQLPKKAQYSTINAPSSIAIKEKLLKSQRKAHQQAQERASQAAQTRNSDSNNDFEAQLPLSTSSSEFPQLSLKSNIPLRKFTRELSVFYEASLPQLPSSKLMCQHTRVQLAESNEPPSPN